MTQKTKDGSREHAHLPIERADAYAGTTLESVVARCAEELRTGGPSAALAYLNGRTRFRYTGMYQVDPPMASAAPSSVASARRTHTARSFQVAVFASPSPIASSCAVT